jgi:hypothetical protein
MILLNSEKQCIYMYRGRRRRVVAAAEEEEEVGGNLPYFPYHFTIQLTFLP